MKKIPWTLFFFVFAAGVYATGCNRLGGGASTAANSSQGFPPSSGSPPPATTPTSTPASTATPNPTPTSTAAPTATPAPTAAANAKRVFITSTTYTGFLGGASAADSICQARAQAGGLGGNWAAWISDGTNNAISRIKDVSPWYLVDGTTLVFPNKGAIASNGPQHAIDLTELKNAPSVTNVWTGTAATGNSSTNNCTAWTSSSSRSTGDMGTATTGSTWTANGFLTCSLGAALYCIEQ